MQYGNACFVVLCVSASWKLLANAHYGNITGANSLAASIYNFSMNGNEGYASVTQESECLPITASVHGQIKGGKTCNFCLSLPLSLYIYVSYFLKKKKKKKIVVGTH